MLINRLIGSIKSAINRKNLCQIVVQRSLGYPVWYPSKIGGAAVGFPQGKLEKFSWRCVI
ncbi:hypothetical protein [Laspinema olomoucense]|uniref:Uncharacterized protein n=1 Tax=Laspinema olomoucense D3b TaxID=2953688 RepID=A0ABT2N7Q3_9CYAN|nr:hypothetical protein [Laspinema sp. D3b]MCT7978733.1 hypothetical protein [Laspinema sp. D3b]